MRPLTRPRRHAFSLVELVAVIAAIGMLAAIAIPRLSRAATVQTDVALQNNLTLLRNSITLYASEHAGAFPGAAGDVVEQLTRATDALGSTRATDPPFGPYLTDIPPCPVGGAQRPSGIHFEMTQPVPDVNPSSGDGWVYNPHSGYIRANTETQDAAGRRYCDY